MSATPSTPLAFFEALHGRDVGILALFSGRRADDRLVAPKTEYLTWPADRDAIARHLAAEVATGREVYACAHLLIAPKRKKPNAAPIRALYADVDHDHIPDDVPRPSIVVRSSPGKLQAYFHLTEAIAPARAEALNQRLAIALNADPSGWDLGQLLRIPGTPNRKYDGAPIVAMTATNDIVHDPVVLERTLPPLPTPPPVTRERPVPPSRERDAATATPPVVLDEEGVAVWEGARPKVKRDGTGRIDRSASLVKIARTLYDAGATRPTVVRALAERDAALGWRKFADRGDADEQYHRVVDALERQGRGSRARPTLAGGTPGGGEPASDRVAVLEHEVGVLRGRVVELETKVAELEKTQSTIIGTFTNPNLKAEAVTTIRLATDAVRRRSRGETPDERGFIRVSPAALGEDYDPWGEDPPPQAIRGKSTINRHLQNLAEAGLVARELRPNTVEAVIRDPKTKRPVIDQATGKPRRSRVRIEETWIRMTGENLAEMLDPFARFRRPDPEPSEAPKPQHGGRRIKGERATCPGCGGTEFACTDCGTIFESPIVLPREGAFHLETVENVTPPGDGTVVRNTEVQDETRSAPRAAALPFANLLDADAETVSPTAADWIRGRPAPPDRYADVGRAGP